jgi:preprotein translocase subunit SecG
VVAFLAAGFMITSILLAVVASDKNLDTPIFESDIIYNTDQEDNEPTVPLAD